MDQGQKPAPLRDPVAARKPAVARGRGRDPGRARLGALLGRLSQRRRSPQAAVMVFVALVCLSLVGFAGWRTWTALDAQLDQARTAAENLARSFAQHADDILSTADAVLVGLVERLETDGFGQPEDLQRLSRHMAAQAVALPGVRDLIVHDADGHWLASSLPFLPTNDDDDDDRAYFAHHRAQVDHRPFVGPPMRSLIDNRWTVSLSRRFNDRDGNLAGIAVATLDFDRLVAYFQAFDTGRSGSIELLNDDGTLLVRHPVIESAIGRDFSDTEIFRDFIRLKPGGNKEMVSPLDGIVRLHSVHHLTRFPLLASVGLSTDEVLAGWQAQADRDQLGVLVFVVLVSLLGWRLAGQLHERHVADRKAARLAADFQLLADNSTDIILRVGLDGTCSYISPSVQDVLGWTAQDLVGAAWDALVPAEDRPLVAEALSQLRHGTERVVVSFRCRRADGSVAWIECRLRLVRDPVSGEPSEVIGNSRDITLHRVAEQQLEEANRRLGVLALQDGLTGLANRRHFDIALDREFRLSARNGTSLGLLLMDVDRFKAYNDRYGHQGGDECLRVIALAIAGLVRRPTDLAARYGGEEVAMLLPETDEEGALILAERVRAAVRELCVPHAGSAAGVVTLSVGVAAFAPNPGDHSPARLVAAADAALYVAKAAGRDAVRSAHRIALEAAPLEVEVGD